MAPRSSRYTESLFKIDGPMIESYAAGNRDQKAWSLTAFNITKSRAQQRGSMMERYLEETQYQRPWCAMVDGSRPDIETQSKDLDSVKNLDGLMASYTAEMKFAETQGQQLWSGMVCSSRRDIESQFKGLASPRMESFAAETQGPKAPLLESVAAKGRAQPPRPMMERYLAETQDQQPWKIPRNCCHRPSQITRPQDGQPNRETTTITDNSVSAGTDIALLRNLYDVSHKDRCEEEQHKHSPKERLSVEHNDKWSLQTESTHTSYEHLSSRDEDGESILSSPSSSSPVSYAGEWSTLDQQFAGLKLTPEMPDAGVEVSPNTNFKPEPRRGDVVRNHQDVAALFAILSRHAYPRDTCRMINYSPAPNDVAPTNHASANEKTRDSSKKRSNYSNQKPKPIDNNKAVNSESDSDDQHQRIRQKTTHGPLEEVEQRAFACPFCKLYPQRYRSMCGETRYPPTSKGLYSLQRHILDKHGPFDPAIRESVTDLPRLRPTERWRELCRIFANVDRTLVPDDPYWYPPRNDDYAGGNSLLLANEIIRDYVLEAQRLAYILNQDLELSRQEAERREHALVADAREQARHERQARDHQIIIAHATRVQQLDARLRPALPFSPDSDHPTVTSSIPELPGRYDGGTGPRVAAEESGSSESRGTSEQPQLQIPVDPSLSLSVTAPERFARDSLIGGTTISDPPAAVVDQGNPSLAASGSEEPRAGSSAPSTPANAASSSGVVKIATSSPPSSSDPNHEKFIYHCNCGAPVADGELCCEVCRLSGNEIAR